MTISSIVRKAGPFDGTGSQTEFPFEFKVFSAGDLYVVQYNEVTEVETVLELDSDYTVTLNADQDNDPGGTIELTSALAVNYTLTITSSLANLQPTDLTNRGGFYPSVINDALDRACIQIQQLQDETDRTLKTAVSVPDGIDNTLPMPAANMVIGWDNTGVALKNWSVNDLVTSVAYGSAKADIFTGDGETVDFYLELDPASINNLDVSVGGVCQVPVDDYTWTSGTKVTFTTAPPDGETVLIRYMQALPQGTIVWSGVSGRPFVDTVVYITQDTTITTGVNVLEGGMFIISSGKTLTINGPFSCGLFQCFSGAGNVVFSAGSVAEVYPEWWGAKPDNSTDCYAAIQAAVTAVRHPNEGESGTVKLGRGIYKISHDIQIPADTRGLSLVGSGPETTQIRNISTTGRDAIKINPTNDADHYCYRITIADLLIQGNGDGTDGIGLYVFGCIQSEFRNVFTRDTGRHGFYFNTSWSNVFFNLVARRAGRGIASNGIAGFYFTNNTGFVVRDIMTDECNTGIIVQDGGVVLDGVDTEYSVYAGMRVLGASNISVSNGQSEASSWYIGDGTTAITSAQFRGCFFNGAAGVIFSKVNFYSFTNCRFAYPYNQIVTNSPTASQGVLDGSNCFSYVYTAPYYYSYNQHIPTKSRTGGMLSNGNFQLGVPTSLPGWTFHALGSGGSSVNTFITNSGHGVNSRALQMVVTPGSIGYGLKLDSSQVALKTGKVYTLEFSYKSDTDEAFQIQGGTGGVTQFPNITLANTSVWSRYFISFVAQGTSFDQLEWLVTKSATVAFDAITLYEGFPSETDLPLFNQQITYYSGSTPVSNITPSFIGQELMLNDSGTISWWKSTGTTSANWLKISN